MRPSSTGILISLLLCTIPAVSAGPVLAQDGKAPAGDGAPAQPTKDEEAKAAADRSRAEMSKQDEAAAKDSIAKLVEYGKDKDVAPETKKIVADVLERYAHQERVAVAVPAIDGLAEMTPEIGARGIRDVLEKALKAKQPTVDVYGACLRGLKKLADPSKATTDLLSDLLKRKENDVIAKAADAISGYKDAPGKVRRDLLEEVLKTGESAYQAAQSGKDSAATAKWNTIQAGVMAALRSLSGQNFADPPAARKWFNDHKKDPKIWG
jgi:hypothetical protein